MIFVYLFLISVLIRVIISIKIFTFTYRDLKHSIKRLENSLNSDFQLDSKELTKKYEKMRNMSDEDKLTLIDNVLPKVHSIRTNLEQDDYKKISPLFDKRYRLFLSRLLANNE